MTDRYVGVYLLNAPYHIDREYTYYLPASLSQDVKVGSVVAVPFGGANRRNFAVVTALLPQSSQEKAKTVLAVLPDRFSLTEEMLGLCFFLKEHTFCSLGDAVRCLLPSAAFSDIRETYRLKNPPPSPCDGEEGRVLSFLSSGEEMTRDAILTSCACRPSVLSRLTDAGYIERLYAVKEETGKTESFVSLAVDGEEVNRLCSEKGGKNRIRSEAAEKILRTLAAEGDMRIADLVSLAHVTSAQVRALIGRSLLKEEKRSVVRDPYASLARGTDRGEICLSRTQNAAYGELCDLYEENAPRCALLFGVTGSGKTKVMMKLIDRVLNEGKSVIVMVPEIALTPQTVGLFCARYGDRTAVIHSSLSEGERFDAWCRIAEGKADLIIGTRSAVFAPVSRLGLIIMDEEHEHTYKSENDPKYHAKDVASYRCGKHNALLLLASATPSVESFYKAECGQYHLVRLGERYGGAALPDVQVVDMREELRAGNTSPVSLPLQEALADTLAAGEQAILFLNRRGYHTSVTCKSCGEPVVCPHCSVSLTYHADKHGGSMFCHLCGYRTSPLAVCPACRQPALSYMGVGTQRAEDEVVAALAGAHVLRMDADTTAGKQSYEKLLDAFRSHEGNVLLGTQMVAKGHDFPAVTLVGVLLADASLYVNDFRANERTFSLLTQVIGRAGRAAKKGRAVIQTYSPSNETIRLACAQDYESFYRSEIAVRRATQFPPFCDIVQLTLSSLYENELMQLSSTLLGKMKEKAKEKFASLPLVIFGPFEAGVYRAAGKYRLRLLVKCRLDKQTRKYFDELLTEFGRENGNTRVVLSLDRNPFGS